MKGETPRPIDELQDDPALWDSARFVVDQRLSKGQYILKDSSTQNKEGVFAAVLEEFTQLQ